MSDLYKWVKASVPDNFPEYLGGKQVFRDAKTKDILPNTSYVYFPDYKIFKSVQFVKQYELSEIEWLKPLSEEDEIQNLKKQLREQIAGAAMSEQSLLELNRKIKENTIDKAIEKSTELYNHYKSLNSDDMVTRYFAGARDAMLTMKTFLQSLK